MRKESYNNIYEMSPTWSKDDISSTVACPNQ